MELDLKVFLYGPICVFFVITEGAFSSHPVLGSQVAEPPLLSLHQTPGAKKSTKTQSQQDEAPTRRGAGWQKPVRKESDHIQRPQIHTKKDEYREL